MSGVYKLSEKGGGTYSANEDALGAMAPAYLLLMAAIFLLVLLFYLFNFLSFSLFFFKDLIRFLAEIFHSVGIIYFLAHYAFLSNILRIVI